MAVRSGTLEEVPETDFEFTAGHVADEWVTHVQNRRRVACRFLICFRGYN